MILIKQGLQRLQHVTHCGSAVIWSVLASEWRVVNGIDDGFGKMALEC